MSKQSVTKRFIFSCVCVYLCVCECSWGQSQGMDLLELESQAVV